MKVLLVGGSFDETLDRLWASSCKKVDDVAVIAVRGALSTSRWSDEGNPESIMEMVQAAIDDTSVSSIVMDIDSPGGEANMMRQLGNLIYKSPKKVVTYAKRMESGALWFGTMSDYTFLSDSIDLVFGSVGAYQLHRSDKEYDKKEGFKYTIINAPDSPHKTWGNPYEDLTDEQIKYFEENATYIRAEFVKAITKARPKISTEGLTGKSYRAEDALSLGFGDKIGTLEDAIAKAKALGAKSSPTPTNNQPRFNYSNTNSMFSYLSKLLGGTKVETVVPPVVASTQTETPATEEQMAAKVEAELARLNAQVEASNLAYNTLTSSLTSVMQAKAQSEAENATLKAQISALQAENEKLKALPADDPTRVGANTTSITTKTEKKSWEDAPWNKVLEAQN